MNDLAVFLEIIFNKTAEKESERKPSHACL